MKRKKEVKGWERLKKLPAKKPRPTPRLDELKKVISFGRGFYTKRGLTLQDYKIMWNIIKKHKLPIKIHYRGERVVLEVLE